MKFLISTANYKSEKDTFDLIDNIKYHAGKQADSSFSVLVFDNSNSILELDDDKSIDINLIKPSRNLGLAPTWKLSMSSLVNSDFDCLILVNNDTEFSEDFFEILTDAIKKDASNAYGPFITLEDGTPWSTGGKFGKLPWIINHEAKDHCTYPVDIYPTEHLSGCCIILPRKVVLDNLSLLVGLSDFFFRGEEWFLNKRLAELNVPRYILRDAFLVHKENGSHSRFSKAHIYWAIRAKMLYIKKLTGFDYVLSLVTYILHVYTKGLYFYKSSSSLGYLSVLNIVTSSVRDGLRKLVVRERDLK